MQDISQLKGLWIIIPFLYPHSTIKYNRRLLLAHGPPFIFSLCPPRLKFLGSAAQEENRTQMMSLGLPLLGLERHLEDRTSPVKYTIELESLTDTLGLILMYRPVNTNVLQ